MGKLTISMAIFKIDWRFDAKKVLVDFQPRLMIRGDPATLLDLVGDALQSSNISLGSPTLMIQQDHK